MEEKLIIKNLGRLLNDKRLQHSIRVGKCAVELAKHYNVDSQKALLAGLLHDCAKGLQDEELLLGCKKYGIELDYVMSYEKGLIHGPLGARMANDIFGIYDPEILSAIKYHTFGHKEMTPLEKIIYLADLIEEKRSYNGVEELRTLVWKDLDKGMLKALEESIISIMRRGRLVHPNTLEARNYMIMSKEDIYCQLNQKE